MQSSPPTRAWERPGSPSQTSDYSLDLSALDPPSGTSTPLPKQHVDRVLSEDIDGPSDFTLNMEKWMRGGTLRKKPTVNTIVERRDGHTQDQGDRSKRDAEMPEEEVRSASRHMPIHSLVRDRATMHDFAQQEEQAAHVEDEEQASSDWDPYHSASTPHPQPPVHKHFLQPTVEDYHSELTPAHLPSVSRPRQSPTQEQASSPHAPNELDETLVSERETEGRPSSPTLSPVRSPIIQRSVPRTTPPTEDLNLPDLARGMQQLQTKCQQLERLNAELEDAMEKERRLRQEDAARHESEMAEAKRREKDLAEMKEEAFRDKEEFRREFAVLREKVRVYEGAGAAGDGRHESEVEALKQKHKARMQAMQEQLEHEAAEHEQELRAMEQDVELAGRSRDDAEEAARVHREELEDLRQAQAVTVARLRQEAQHSQQSLDERKQAVQAATRDRDVARADAYEKTQATATLRTELETLGQTQQEETKQLISDHLRAVQLAESHQVQLKQLRQQLRDEQSAHDAELDALRNQQARTVETDTLRNELEAAHSHLNAAVIDRDSAVDDCQNLRDQVAEAQMAVSRLQSEIEELRTEHREVNAALDTRIAEAGRKREVYWRGRLEGKERERVMMARALLRGWGREEVGVTKPDQAYEFRFVAKQGAKAGA